MKTFNIFFGRKSFAALFAIPIFSLLAFVPSNLEENSEFPFNCAYQLSYDLETTTTVMPLDPNDLKILTDSEKLAVGSITENQSISLCLDNAGDMDLTIEKLGTSNSTFIYPEPEFEEQVGTIRVTGGRIILIGESGEILSDKPIDEEGESGLASEIASDFTASSEDRATQVQDYLAMATAAGASVSTNGSLTTVTQTNGNTIQKTVFNNQSNVAVFTSVTTGGNMQSSGYFNYNCNVIPHSLTSTVIRNYTVSPKTGKTMVTTRQSNYTNFQSSDNR